MTARKATNIHQAMADIKSLSTQVLEYKGSVATLASEIAELSSEMQDNQGAQDEATAIREKENSEYLAQKAEMEQTLNALERGIKVLMGAGTGGDESLLQTRTQAAEMKLMLVAKDVHVAVQKLPAEHLLSPTALAKVSSFLQDPADYLDQKAKKSASYSPASATIQGILKDMYDTFSMNLEKATETEATQQKNFETLMATKSKEMSTLASTREAKEGHKAEAEKNLADASQELDDTKAQMEADTALFDDTKAACNSKAAATQTKSLALAQLAAQLRTGGHFDAVVSEIDKMIAVHKGEEQDDIEQRDWCKEETFKNEQEAARLTYKIEKHVSKLSKLNKKLEDLEASKADTVSQIQQTNEDIASMEESRIAEHNAFQSAKSDDEQASQLLAAAIEAMSAFYKNNGMETGPIQGGANALLQTGEPVFERSADEAPDASFSSAGKSGGESKGIISLMTMIKEDLDDEVSNGVKNEKKAQKEFQAQLDAAKKLVDDLTLKKTNLETGIADTNQEITDENVAKEGTEGLLTEEKDYLMSIKPDCDWILKEFQPRRDTRAQEVQGLIDAKGMLLGAANPALVQQPAKFNDADFDNMRFLAPRQ